MRAMKLLSEGEIYAKILKEKLNPSDIELLMSLDNVKPFTIPTNYIAELPFLKKTIKISKNPLELLIKAKIQFEFDEFNLDIISKNNDFVQKNKLITLQYILFSFVGWQLKQSQSIAPVSLFSALVVACDPDVFAEYFQYRFIAISAFYILYSQCFKQRKTQLNEYLPPLLLFLSQYRELPEHCYNLVLFAVQCCSSQHSSVVWSEDFSQLLSFSTTLDLPSSVATSLIQTTVYQLSSLENSALSVFGNLILHVTGESVNHFMELIAMSMGNYSNLLAPLVIPPSSKPYTLQNNQTNEGLFRFLANDIFPDGMSFENLISFDDPGLSTLIEPGFLKKVDIILVGISKSQVLTKTFITAMMSTIALCISTPQIYLLYATLLYICNNCDFLEEIRDLGKFFLNDIIFDPGITFDQKKNNFSTISRIRSESLLIASRIDVQGLDQFLFKIKITPLLFTECIYRLLSFNETNCSHIIISKSLIQSAIFYRPFVSNSNEVSTAFKAIFLYFYTMFQQPSIVSRSFESILFVQGFLAFLYEPKIRPFVLTQTRQYLIQDNTKDNPGIIELLINIVELTCHDFPEEKSVLLASDLYQTINDILVHKASLLHSFQSLLFTALKTNNVLSFSNVNVTFFDNLLSFSALISMDHNFSAPELNSLEQMIKFLYENNNIPITIFYKLIQLASSTMFAGQSTSIMIKQPKVLKLLIILFKESRNFIEIVKFISGICQYSYKNCIACHTGEIDLLFIDLLKEEDKIEDETKEEIFKAFNKISTVVSSVSVMQHYISLLCPESIDTPPSPTPSSLLVLDLGESPTKLSKLAETPSNSANSFENMSKLAENLSSENPSILTTCSESIPRSSSLSASTSTNLESDSSSSNLTDTKLLSNDDLSSSDQLNKSKEEVNSKLNEKLTENINNHIPLKSPTKKLTRMNSNSNLSLSSFSSLNFNMSSKVVTNLEFQALKALSNNMYQSRKLPISSMPLTRDSFIKLHNIPTSELTEGFAFVIWLYHEPTDATYKPQLFFIGEENDKMIKITLSQSQLVITHCGDDYDTVATVDVNIKARQWVLLSIEYANDYVKGGTVCVVSCNCQDPKKVALQDLHWKKRFVDVTIGGLSSDSPLPLYCSRIAGFGFFKSLTESHLMKIIEAGPRIDPPPFEQTFLSAKTILQQNELFVQETQSNYNITLSYKYNNKETLMSLSEVLGHLCKVEFLLPLFSQLDLINEQIDSFFDLIIDVFSNALSMSQKAQQLFYEASGFDIISHLLMTCNAKLITYHIYAHFYGICEVISESNLQSQLLDSILLNEMIWIRADSFNHLKIVKHWARVIFVSYETIFMKLRSIKNLLTTAKLFYQTNVPDINAYKYITSLRDPRLNTFECRKVIFQIIQLMAAVTFTDDDFLYLIGMIVTANDHDLCLDYLNFLVDLLEMNPSPIQNVTVDALTLLMMTFSFNDENIITKVFHIIYIANKNNMLKGVLIHEHIYIIMRELTLDVVREPVFNSLMDLLLKGFYDILPIVSWLSINLGSKAMIKLIEKLEPNKNYVTHLQWMFWPTVLLLKCPKHVSNKLIDFILFSDLEGWSNFYMMINLCARLTNGHSTEYRQMMLNKIVDYLLVKKKNELIESFFSLAKSYILYHNNNSALQTLLTYSPFNIRRMRSHTNQIPRFSPERKQSAIHFNVPNISLPPRLQFPDVSALNLWITPAEVEKQIQSMESNFSKEAHVFFSLQIGPDGEWVDAELAKKCLDLYLFWNNSNYLDFDLILCAFLIPYYYDKVFDHFTSLNLNSQEVSKLLPFLSLINTKCEDNSRPMIFKIPVKNMRFSSFSALETIANNAPPNAVHGIVIAVNQLIRFFKNNKEKSNGILKFQSCPTIMSASQSPKRVLYSLQKKKRDDERKWIRLWRNLTIDGAPWSSCLEHSLTDKLPLKRDQTLCTFICPAKLKRNWNLTNQSLTLEKSMSVLFQSSTGLLNNRQNSTENVVIDKNFIEVPCHVVSIEGQNPADFIITNTTIGIKKHDTTLREYTIDQIQFMIERRRINKQSAIEIFFHGGTSKLLSFDDKYFAHVQAGLKARHISELTKETANLNQLMKMWQNREISTFEYLMKLNMISGRTFSSLQHYPIMPWIISDYESKVFDCNDSMFLRDVRKPMSQVGQERLMRIITKMQETGVVDFSLPGSPMRPCDICSYLCRLHPFSEQDYDEPCLSISKAFNKATNDDKCYSELVPEFFYMPEAFLKTNPKNKTQEMEFPAWSNNDAFTFVYLNRKALECDLISSSINQWIDLIWGTKQRDSGAISAFNKFISDVYEDSENFDIYDGSRSGFVPGRLFTEPHPPRFDTEKVQNQITSPLIIQTQNVNTVVYSNYAVLSSNVMEVMILDSIGKVTVHTLDFTQLQKYTNKGPNMIRQYSSQSSISLSQNSESDNGMSNSMFVTKTSSLLNQKLTNENESIISSVSFERLQNLTKSEIRTPTGTNSSSGFMSSNSNSSLNILPPPNVSAVVPNFLQIALNAKYDMFSFIDRNTLMFVDNGLLKTFSISTKTTQILKMHTSDVTILSLSKQWLCASSRGSVLNFCRVSDLSKVVFSIPLYRDSIQCVNINPNYSLAVAGTRDGFLFFVSLTHGTVGATVDLQKARPYKVIVTSAWGFVVVYMTELERGSVRHYLALYSPNGRLIKRRTIGSGISCWNSFKTADGFDYVVCADDRGRLWVFEAFFLSMDEFVYRCNGQVTNVTYSTDQNGIVATTADGRILFVPHKI